jgi:uncharacterized damage-inducible protein DinB
MLALIRDLLHHKADASTAMLDAVRATEAARNDPEVLALLHHVWLANRFWLLAVLDQPFDHDREARPPASLDDLAGRYAGLHDAERNWLTHATDADLARRLRHPLIPARECSVVEALMQVCLHTHGHRAQCAKLLRRHGGTPPGTDFITWLAGRSSA